jgi:hypothetical protein
LTTWKKSQSRQIQKSTPREIGGYFFCLETDSTVRPISLLVYDWCVAGVLLLFCWCITDVRLDLRIEWIGGRLDVVKVIITLTLTVPSGLRKDSRWLKVTGYGVFVGITCLPIECYEVPPMYRSGVSHAMHHARLVLLLYGWHTHRTLSTKR